ncbi:MAG: FAD-dependent oxidoreductase, partial [Candidatus Ranarchaeia archaeon]
MRDRDNNSPRIGVFVCQCGGNISDVVDVVKVAETVNDLPDVVTTKHVQFLCSKPSLKEIRDAIDQHQLDRLVLACCTPKMHKKKFEREFESAGLNASLLEIVNIREQDSFVHATSPEGATQKAIDLIRGALSHIRLSIPMEKKSIDVTKKVLVVGGGIAGIIASLRVAQNGLQVYLVEKKPSIGGHMIQLPKVFPTLDCSQCILTPRLGDVGDEENIELLTCAEIEEISGDGGNFHVKVKLHPRYVDTEACTACGECVKVCPVNVPDEFNLGMNSRKAIYKPFLQAQPPAFVIDKRGISNCRATCPAHINVQGYLGLTASGKHDEAISLIREEIPFPGICGRVCFRPCEANCSRCQVDEPVAINQVKRFLADYERSKGGPKAEPYPILFEEKVAIIGAGPAGLTAAWALAKKGISATIFEKRSEPGGMMRYGIPAYRLPREILDYEINYIKKCGVEIKLNQSIGEGLTIDGLLETGYNVVLIATGTWVGRRLNVPGENLDGVESAIDFLSDVNSGVKRRLTGTVVVVGGGDAAFDAARTASRIGADKVIVLYRRTKQEMPASPEEVLMASEEGIHIQYLTQPVRFTGDKGRVNKVECVKMVLGDPDESGRRRPVEVKDSNFEICCSHVFVAIGQDTDTGFLDSSIETEKNGVIKVDPVTLMTTKPGVFAAGDVMLGPKTVIDAIATGKEAAESIRRYIEGKDLRAGRNELPITVEPENTQGIQPEKRIPVPMVDVSQ